MPSARHFRLGACLIAVAIVGWVITRLFLGPFQALQYRPSWILLGVCGLFVASGAIRASWQTRVALASIHYHLLAAIVSPRYQDYSNSIAEMLIDQGFPMREGAALTIKSGLDELKGLGWIKPWSKRQRDIETMYHLTFWGRRKLRKADNELYAIRQEISELHPKTRR